MKFSLGGIVGAGLNAVGLEKIAPIASAAINAFTGNRAATVDATGILGNIKGLSFLKNVAALAPPGGFDKGGFNITKLFGKAGLSSERLDDLRSLVGIADKASGGKLNNFAKALNVVDETIQNAGTLRQTIRDLRRVGTHA